MEGNPAFSELDFVARKSHYAQETRLTILKMKIIKQKTFLKSVYVALFLERKIKAEI